MRYGVRDRNCIPQYVLGTYSSLELNYRFQDAGSWVLKMPQTPGNPDTQAMLNNYIGGAGLGGIIVTRNGVIIFSGPTTGFEADGDFTSVQDQQTITFFGTDDTGILSYRLCMMPDPNQDAATYNKFVAPYGTGWTYFTYGLQTSPSPPARNARRSVSSCMYNLVSNNIGPTAPFNLAGTANRRIRQIVLPPIPRGSYGPNFNTRSRYENLLEELKFAAVYIPNTPFTYSQPQKGPYEGLGFGILQVPGTRTVSPGPSPIGKLNFTVFEPNDLSKSVIFSKGFGNLASYRYSNHAPEGNFIVCGGMNNNPSTDPTLMGAPFNVKNRFFFHAGALTPRT